MEITKTGNTQITDNFNESEFYNAALGEVGDSFFLNDSVIAAGQIIRNYFGVPVKVNTTYRTVAYEKEKGRSGKSKHTLGLAIDYDMSDDILLKYHEEILTKGDLYNQLRSAGINAFGLYDNFLHIDARPEGGKQKDSYGSFAFWDNRITTKKKFQA